MYIQFFSLPVVNVGFTGTQYEVEAGEKVEVCVIAEAIWRLEKMISVDLILFAGSTGNHHGGRSNSVFHL